ncbi:hypothetical protein B0H15DRAFT_834147 [Mycena belliarum]|uniref:F-box domain-containing protein n=1 Tax=Mycena belliarum TaxID=1033014 RepID=A0AAD6U7R9_9AGAR|nr:hypothetical protein B0H15DRAFT_834147 [Mycena belliae]
MHNVFRILELVEMIFSHLLQPESEQATRFPDINAFGRTCKFFSNHALSLMWRKQYTLTNFFKSMPADLWEETEDNALTLLRPISPSDWERPLIYADYIKHFVLVEIPPAQDILSAPVLETLGLCVPRQHLFPNLETIGWAPTYTLFPYLRLFLGPKIKGVNIHFPDTIPAFSLLPALSLRYPALTLATLRHLCVDDEHAADPQLLLDADDLRVQYVSLFVRRLTQIVALDVDVVDQAAFEHLGQLQTLRTLNIGEFKRPTTMPQLPFPALTTLHFRDTSIALASTYLDGLHNCRLAMLFIDVTSPAVSIHATKLYAALSTSCAPAALQALNVQNASWYHGWLHVGVDPASYLVPRAALRSLCCFTELVMVNLQSPTGFDLDDETAWMLARAWPRLRLLALKADTAMAHYAPHATLDALRAFAQHCPELESLVLTFTAIVVPSESAPPQQTQSLMVQLGVGASPISSAAPVAGFISALFPALRTILIEHDRDETQALWDQVGKLLPAVQSEGDWEEEEEEEEESDDSDESQEGENDGEGAILGEIGLA